MLANLAVKAPALVHQEIVLWAQLGKSNEYLTALDRTWVDHANKSLVPVVQMNRHFVHSLFEICPGMVYKKVGLKLPILKSVSFDGFRDAPDTIKPLEEFRLAR